MLSETGFDKQTEQCRNESEKNEADGRKKKRRWGGNGK